MADIDDPDDLASSSASDAPDASADGATAAPAPSRDLAPAQPSDHWRSEDDAAAPPARHWRPALARWLLTLNPGRTQDEYEKAVRYFFATPGAPQDLGDLSFDMLLAYRGALTLRADRRRRSTPRRAATNSGRLAARRMNPWSAGAIGAAAGGSAGDAGSAPAASLLNGPLSPATVNVRLTALRQFLLFAIEQRLLSGLSAEQIRSALRRLRNERRRPYQILAEEEWDAFLFAALGALGAQPSSETPDGAEGEKAQAAPLAPPAARGSWGVTRAQREQAREQAARDEAHRDEPALAPEHADDAQEPAAQAVHARDGRTGAQTAQRDHALIALALATGLRAIELSLLDVGDLVGERRRGQMEWWLALPDEKTKGQRGGRSLPLAPELMTTLLDYIRSTGRSWSNPAHRATPLFLALARGRAPVAESAASRAVALAGDQTAPRYRRLRPEQIRSVIHRVEAQWLAQRRAATVDLDDPDDLMQAAETRRISPHTLRHSAAIALLLGDEATERPPASVEHVRGWLGHFDIRTTQRYLAHLESREQRRRFAIRPGGRPAPAAQPTANPAPPDDAHES